MSDNGHESLFGSPPPSPILKGRSSRPRLALPCTRTSNSAASAFEINNQPGVGTTALLGLHQFFNNDNSSVVLSDASTSTAPSRPPALTARASSVAAKTRGPPATTTSTARQRPAPRPLAEPLEFPEQPAKGRLLRSHPSLLGRAGNVGGLDPSRSSPSGTHASNPIVVDDTPHSSTPSTGQFKPKFHGSNYWKRRAATPNQMQKSQSAREILQAAIRNPASSDQKAANEEAPIIQVLKGDKRFHNLIRDLMAFSKTLEGGLQPPSSSTKPPPPKRRKTRHGPIPAGSQHWAVPFPFAEASKPALYDEKWRNDNIRRLLKELVEVMRDAQKAVTKENCFAVKPRPRKRSQSNASASPQRVNCSQDPLSASVDASTSETPTTSTTE